MTSSPSNALVALERQFEPLAPHFAQVLGSTMPVERLIRTVMVSVERNDKLLECNRQTLFNAAMSAAVLGLEVDGVTGQAFLIPFSKRAQLVIGYRGYNTLAGRANVTITGGVVRAGDFFDYDLGSGEVHHKKPVGNSQARIIQAWAKASHLSRPPVLVVMDVDELNAVKARSPGAEKKDSPWNDPLIGYPAMCEKTPKRRLARSLPLMQMSYAAAMEQAVEEQGRGAWISPDKGVVIEGLLADSSDSPTGPHLVGDLAGSSADASGGAGATTVEGPALLGYVSRLKTAALNGSTPAERTESLKAEWEALPRAVQAALAPGKAALKATAKTGIAP